MIFNIDSQSYVRVSPLENGKARLTHVEHGRLILNVVISLDEAERYFDEVKREYRN